MEFLNTGVACSAHASPTWLSPDIKRAALLFIYTAEKKCTPETSPGGVAAGSPSGKERGANRGVGGCGARTLWKIATGGSPASSDESLRQQYLQRVVALYCFIDAGNTTDRLRMQASK